jgi:hypothetical protein
MEFTWAVAATSTLVMLSGCGNLNSVYRDLNTADGRGALIDIKQRAIVVAKRTAAPNDVIVCAEPSPDALSAYAAELAAKADLPNGMSAQLSSALQESASFTGLRTQSIQLLRDSMYRICEAHMNGAITQGQYDLLARRYQKHTVALLAIEQLTGIAKVPPITINTSGSAEAARSISEMRTQLASIEKQVANLTKKKEGASADQTKAIDESLKSLESDKEAIITGIEHARGTLVSGNAAATVNAVALPANRSDSHVAAVAGTVERIVQAIVNADDTGQLCFLQMQIEPKRLSEGGKQLQQYCSRVFEMGQAEDKVRLEALQIALESLKLAKDDGSGSKSEQARQIAEQIEGSKKAKLLTLPIVPTNE